MTEEALIERVTESVIIFSDRVFSVTESCSRRLTEDGRVGCAECVLVSVEYLLSSAADRCVDGGLRVKVFILFDCSACAHGGREPVLLIISHAGSASNGVVTCIGQNGWDQGIIATAVSLPLKN